MSAVLELDQLELTKTEVIYGVSWETYEALIEKYQDNQSPRLTYDSGIMEVEMANSIEYEKLNRDLSRLIELLLLELGIDFVNGGSATFTNSNIHKGFEPDTCFYIQSIEQIGSESNIGVENKFPPDLTIEINRTSSSVPRMPVFAAFGVKEVWRFSDESVKFYVLENGVYLETKLSIAIPVLSSERATEFLQEAGKFGNIAWVKKIRNWVNSIEE